MKILHSNRLLLCLMLIFFSQFIQAQNAISEKITQKLTQIESTTSYTPLEAVAADELKNRITDDILNRKQFFQLKNQTVQTIKNNDSEYLQITIPIAGENTELQLVKAKIFTDDFRAVAASNPDAALQIDLGIHYRGTVKGKDKSIAVISFFDNEMMGLIQVNDVQYTIGKMGNSQYHILYKNSDLDYRPEFSCETIPLKESGTVSDIVSVEKSMAGCVRLHVEVDYSLYQTLGSDMNNVFNYLAGVFAEVFTLYANESVEIYLMNANVWDIPSPYTAGNELDDLDAQNYGRRYGDLVHLLHANPNGSPGAAYVGAVCSGMLNTGFSRVDAAYNNVPVYSWDVNVIAHELGHNLGSSHTHDCVWNGNNTQIDDCGNKALDEDNDPDTEAQPCYDSNNPILPASGTIMSYCHVDNNIGVDFNLGLGTQPGDVIRNHVNTATCIASGCANPTCDDGFQNGSEAGIDCGGSSCLPCPTCDDGIENGDEQGVDCGGASCDPCYCGDNPVTIIINLDVYPEETTWRLELDGAAVASGGPYQTPGGTIVEYDCVPNGCFYTFEIRDAYQDGICCDFGYGSYTVIGGDGSILASGGQFGASEETEPFCLINNHGVEFCEPILDLGTATLRNGTAHAQNKIISGGDIPSGRNTTLKAGQTIHLESGFNVDANADVKISIEDCVPD